MNETNYDGIVITTNGTHRWSFVTHIQ